MKRLIKSLIVLVVAFFLSGYVAEDSYFKSDAEKIESLIDKACIKRYGKAPSQKITIIPTPDSDKKSNVYDIFILMFDKDPGMRESSFFMGILATGRITAKTKWTSENLWLADKVTGDVYTIETKYCRKATRMSDDSKVSNEEIADYIHDHLVKRVK